MNKKIKAWLFREDLELNKHWWHRLVKVIFLSFFFITTIGASVLFLVNPEDIGILSKHNISIKNSLYQFTENYDGLSNDNTIPIFFEQKGNFGVLMDKKIDYISSYSLGNSICMREPDKHQDAILFLHWINFRDSLDYGKDPGSLENFKNVTKEYIFKDASKKCFFYDINEYAEELRQIENLSSAIVNYKPSIVFYVEAILGIVLMSLIYFAVYILIYYRLILYIVYGNKK
jgi:hypothetical protein